MAEKYEITRTSQRSAVVSDTVLWETDTTRLTLRPEIVRNPHNAEASVKVAFVHQRKSPKGTWEDVPTKPFSALKAGEEVKLPLHSESTLKLFHELRNLYALATQGKIGRGTTNLVVGPEKEMVEVGESRARGIKLLLEKGYSDDIWKELIASDPDLATRLSDARIHAKRQEALEEFRINMGRRQGEPWWQDFFERNTWIFGYGLKYQILKPIQAQPYYGGTNVTGTGAERGDFLQHTEADSKFTVLVDIKKPETLLLTGKLYRNGAWVLGEDLIGGVSQLQANCRRWEVQGSRTDENRETLAEQGILTVQPKGVLVIGHTKQLTQTGQKISFELFRRNVINPEIVTFDELYERAKYIVERTAQNAEESAQAIPVSDEDNVPF